MCSIKTIEHGNRNPKWTMFSSMLLDYIKTDALEKSFTNHALIIEYKNTKHKITNPGGVDYKQYQIAWVTLIRLKLISVTINKLNAAVQNTISPFSPDVRLSYHLQNATYMTHEDPSNIDPQIPWNACLLWPHVCTKMVLNFWYFMVFLCMTHSALLLPFHCVEWNTCNIITCRCTRKLVRYAILVDE